MSELHRVDLRAGSLAEIALGLTALIPRFDALVDAYAPPRAATGSSDEAADPVLEIVLGLLAIRGRLGAQLDGCEAGRSQAVDVPARESWLR